ncbi:snRNA-activating protein complex subunit 2 [Trichomycterus rosablanca]|uniref:snRNA-activating protein complex subunit 2 n=1 Tax=Trichomycterus rosablanca TaxID=2290929 RepID=UPI002F360646
MKPPSRHRHLPSRFLALNKTESRRNSVTSWHRQDLKMLLFALKQQHKLKKLDVFELRKKVPKSSLPEFHNMIKSLKKQVVRQVYLQVQKQRQEELKIKVPIEIWAELAKRMTGVHEETLSSAFSQMLIIAATEPCSLLHSDPPRSINTPDLVANNLHTVPMSPLCMSPSLSKMPSTPSPVIILPVQTCRMPGNDAGFSPSAQTTRIMTLPHPVLSHAENKSSESNCMPDNDSLKPSTPRTPKSLSQPSSSQNQPVLKSAPSVSILKAVSNAPVLLSSTSNQPVKPSESGQSNQGHLSKSICMNFVVDFENIYRFLASINNKNNNPTLTAMENAVVFDLLMCLPEELPLLDCKELQHHLLLEYTRLNRPPSKPSNDQGPAFVHPAEGTEVTSQALSGQTAVEKSNQKEGVTEQNTKETPKHKGDKADWAASGLCPINLFMVPVALLKRQ